MPQRGSYARRNAGHKDRQSRRLASAAGDRERLSAAYDWFRSAAGLLARRRTPKGIDQEVHRATAARLMREVAEHLRTLASDIDRGEYDAGKG